jgi:DNA-binding transcriptional MerR regulator
LFEIGASARKFRNVGQNGGVSHDSSLGENRGTFRLTPVFSYRHYLTLSHFKRKLIFVDRQMTLAEIAEESGIPARTIRFYIARGLLSGPVKGGRGAVYTAEHLGRLTRIKHLQTEGNTLSDIARILAGVSAEPEAPTPWWQYAIAEDVVVWVSAGASPWRLKQIRSAVEEFGRRVQSPKEGRNE